MKREGGGGFEVFLKGEHQKGVDCSQKRAGGGLQPFCILCRYVCKYDISDQT